MYRTALAREARSAATKEKTRSRHLPASGHGARSTRCGRMPRKWLLMAILIIGFGLVLVLYVVLLFV